MLDIKKRREKFRQRLAIWDGCKVPGVKAVAAAFALHRDQMETFHSMLDEFAAEKREERRKARIVVEPPPKKAKEDG